MRLRLLGALMILASIIHLTAPAPEAQQAKVPRIGVLLLAYPELV